MVHSDNLASTLVLLSVEISQLYASHGLHTKLFLNRAYRHKLIIGQTIDGTTEIIAFGSKFGQYDHRYNYLTQMLLQFYFLCTRKRKVNKLIFFFLSFELKMYIAQYYEKTGALKHTSYFCECVTLRRHDLLCPIPIFYQVSAEDHRSL